MSSMTKKKITAIKMIVVCGIAVAAGIGGVTVAMAGLAAN